MDDIESIRKETVFRIGRNLVNLQRVERLLKFLVTISYVEGTPQTIEAFVSKRAAEMERRPIGWVVEDFHKAVKRTQSDHEAPENITEIWISSASQILPDGVNYAEWRKSLRDLVKERNFLVHQVAKHFNHTSQESCEALSKRLDEQNDKVKNTFELLKAAYLTHQQALNELKELVDSDEFLHQLEEALGANDAKKGT